MRRATPAARSSPRRAFTLLEALVALAILSAALLAVVQVRSQLLAAAAPLSVANQRAADERAITTLIVERALPAPVVAESGEAVWQLDILGSPCRIVRAANAIPNPVAGQVPYDVRPTLTLYRYRVERPGHTFEFLWRH